jgi:hypothetical protein
MIYIDVTDLYIFSIKFRSSVEYFGAGLQQILGMDFIGLTCLLCDSRVSQDNVIERSKIN